MEQTGQGLNLHSRISRAFFRSVVFFREKTGTWGYRPLYHTGHRTAKVIASLGVRWLALVEPKGPKTR